MSCCYNVEVFLAALKNTTTKQGAKRALKTMQKIYPQIEGSFYAPQIKAELDRLQTLTK